MFLAWSFFEMFFFLFFFQLLLSIALGATLAFYSRIRKGYAHSLRWIYQGDVLEMIKIGRLSMGKKLPSNISRALWVTLTLSIFISVVDTVVKVFVKDSIQGVNPSSVVNKRYQLTNLDGADVVPGWAISLPPSSLSLKDSIIQTINSTRNIQAPVPGRIYTPRQLPYETVCTSFNLFMLTKNLTLYPNLYSPNNGCANLTIFFTDLLTVNLTTTVITRRSNPNGVKVVIPGTYQAIGVAEADLGYWTFSPGLDARVDYQNNKCLTGTDVGNVLMNNDTGIDGTPQTAVTKCIFSSGHVTTMSVTSVRYSVPDPTLFHSISQSVFQSSTLNPLVLAIQDSITDGTLINLTNNTLDSKSVMEIQFSNTKVDLLRCTSRRAGTGGNVYLSCIYSIVTTVMAEPQPMMPEIVDLRGADKSFPAQPILAAMMSFDHLPKISGVQGSVSTFEIDSLLSQSASVAQYFASLGQNFFMDWDDGALYTVFDTVDLRKGYEIPVGLFGVVIATMTFCLILWIAAEVSLDVRYKGSMLWVLTEEMESYLDRPTPTIVKVNPDLLVVEGIPLVAKVELLNLKEEYEEE